MKANILTQLTNMRHGGYISAHDYKIAEKIADIFSGGGLDEYTKVNSKYLLSLEKKHFIELLKETKTQERIENMLINHKPLRN